MGFLDLLWSLVTNYVLASAVIAWFVAQILKVCTGIFRLKKFSVTEMLFGTGGMPSSHTASVCAAACAAAIKYGLGSAEFAIAMILAMIVIRDATGMRREVGEHAKALNLILQDLIESKDAKITERALNELAGHTPLQVVCGAILGFAVPFLVTLIPVFNVTL
jgi:acid phosphatase family membrane protein YuiD